MSIALPPELEAFVQQELASGQYQSEEEVVCQGLRLLQERKRKLEELRREIQLGIDELDRGEGIRIETKEELRAFFDDIEARGLKRLQAENERTDLNEAV